MTEANRAGRWGDLARGCSWELASLLKVLGPGRPEAEGGGQGQRACKLTPGQLGAEWS